ncbi:MAG: MotA/TolQ/ExbB proton channel family protein [Candidatus Omnitrophica bacterium]|nr:MotA/TolQ/ExbB proton channel family protein [Candidatus Omnitrophota bacterium]
MMMWESAPWQLFSIGGPLLWPILFCSVFATAIVIDRVLFFYSLNEDVAALKRAIFIAVRNNDIKSAMTACDVSATPLARVLKAGLMQYGRGKEEIAAAMAQVVKLEAVVLRQRLPALAAIGRVVPLLGFLGTVTALCSLFHTMSVRSQAFNQLTPADVSRGVWSALITTEAGLIVMIPCVLAYSFLADHQDRYGCKMAQAAADLADFLVHTAEPPAIAEGDDESGPAQAV